MKITRVPVRKPAPLPADLANAVKHLLEDDEKDIQAWIVKTWNFPRGDLFQYAAVLNRFDEILETICHDYELEENQIQKKPFLEGTKQMLLAILNFSKTLFENCTNRNIYNSYEHLNNLLNTTDIDILEAVLRLMLRPAQRVNNPRAIQSSFSAHQDKVTELSRGGSIADFSSTKISAGSSQIYMSFFRTSTSDSEGGGVKEEEEGLHAINTNVVPNQLTDLELFWKLVKEHQVPKENHFELLNRVRIANHATDIKVRQQLLIIRFIAIVIMAHTMSETIAQNRVFIYEPHLVPQIAQLVSYDNSIPVDIQTYALYALDGIAQHRAKVTEVLTAFNASANHGVLLHILRQLCQPNLTYTDDFLDALFTLLAFLLQTSAGGTMLMSAGIMSTLIQVLDHSNVSNTMHKKVLIKVIELLDTIMSNINASLSSFCSANGIDVLLKVIQTQVDECINSNQQPPNHDTLTLVKNALRFLTCMMNSGDTADSLRNLIESSIPHTIMKVMEHHHIFGPRVFSLAINVVTTFIHNEPTSLSVLQEIKLPQTFLKTFESYDQPNSEVLMASVDSFGAICLNDMGLDMFIQSNTLPHFFTLMTTPSFVTNASDVGNATSLGTTIDELIRHQPKLKGEVFKCANQLLQQVIEIGHSDKGKPLDDCHELVYETRLQDPPAERAQCLLLGFVDLVARFLEGFLRNVENIKEFVKYGGSELLLRYYTLPMLPYDFSVSNAFDSLGFVFRVIADVSPNALSKLISEKVYESSKFIFTDLSKDTSTVYAYIQANDDASRKAANEMFRKFSILFGYIGLLSTIFSSAILTNNKFAGRLVEWCIEDNSEYGSIVQLLGDIHRTMVWQNILLRDSVPQSWYASSTQLHQQQSMQEKQDLKDPQIINVRRFKLLLSEVPPALMPVLQGIIKVSTNRRIPAAAGSSLSFPDRAKSVAAEIANLFDHSLHYMLPAEDVPDCKYDYYSAMFSMISMLLLDDRSRTALETPIAVAFEKKGVIDFLLNQMLPRFWEAAEEKIKAGEQNDVLAHRINTCIELLLAILHHLGSSQLLFNSPHTSILTTLHPDDDLVASNELMDPYHWMASMQLKLTGLYKYLQSPILHKFSNHVLHSLLRCITQNMNYEGESPPRTSMIDPIIANAADDNSIQHFDTNRRALISMGFEPDRVDDALRNLHYGICALDNLFSRRLVQHTVEAGPPHLVISADLASSNPLTPAEFDAGVRILVNMWYDPNLATESLRENNNLAQAAMSLARYNPSALRTPSNQPMEDTIVEDDNDDQFVDIESEDEEGEADDNMYTTEEEDDEMMPIPNNLTKKGILAVEHAEVKKTRSDLEAIRKEMRAHIPQILSCLVNERSDLDLEVRMLLAMLCCGDPNERDSNSKEAVRLFFSDSIKDKDIRSTFESSINKIRIFALLLREPSMQDIMSALITTMSDYMNWFGFLDLIVAHPESSDPNVLTPLFVILEVCLNQSDEPKDSSTTQSQPAVVTSENRMTLMKYCIDLLKMDNLIQCTLICVLRLIMRLTKHHAAALQFVKLGGLVPLFKRPSSEFKALKLQQIYIIMILRHIIETKDMMIVIMRESLVTFFTNPRTDIVDIEAFLRKHNHLVFRDPEVFVDVTTQLCRLGRSSRSIRYIGTKNNMNAPQSIETPSIVMHFLLNQLMQAHANVNESNIILCYTGFLLQCIFELVSFYPSCKYDLVSFATDEAVADDGDENEDRLQNTSAIAPINVCVRQSILFKLTSTLLPYNAINILNDEDRKKQGVSMWVAYLLTGICYVDPHVREEDKEHYKMMLADVRKHVLDVVALLLKDTLQSDATASIKYNRYFALTELCHRILNARPPSSNVEMGTNEEGHMMEVAKLMLEKKLVPILLSVISDVDVNYPQAKSVLNSILRPLEQLTKFAIRIYRDSPPALDNIQREIDQASHVIQAVNQQDDHQDANDDDEDQEIMYIPMDTEEEDIEDGEVNDLYRNSSLAMFDGTVLEEENSQEESDDDISMATSGEEIIDDDSDSGALQIEILSDSSTDGNEEEEEEEEDEDIVFRRHRFHHADTDEEDESDSDVSDAESDSHSESNSFSSNEYDSSNESFNSDRSDSIHSDDSRDLAWQIAEEGRLNGHYRRNRRDSINLTSHHDDDDMDIDSVDYEMDTDGLNAEELEDVERNLDIFNSMSHGAGGRGSRIDDVQIINPTVRGFLNNNSSNANSAGRPFDNIVMNSLLRGTPSDTADIPADPTSMSAETSILCGANSNHLQAYEDIIGGSAVRILENLFSQQRQRNNRTVEPSGNAAINDSTVTDAASRSNADEMTNPSAKNSIESTAAMQETKDTLALLKEFKPAHTTDRWSQEVNIMYNLAVASSKAAKLSDTVIAKLTEISQNEPKDENQEQENSQEFANKMEPQWHDAQYDPAFEEIDDDVFDIEEDEVQSENEQESRITVMIHGEPVDITGTGIDVEFLEALPDDLRAEVISQQMAENHPSIESMDENEISSEFLDALPSDIRNEVLRQQSIDRSRRQAREYADTQEMPQSNANNNAHLPNVAVNTTELNGMQMHPNLGLASHASFSAPNLGPVPTRNDASTTWRPGRFSNQAQQQPENNNDNQTTNTAHTTAHHHRHKDAIRIVDRAQLATLSRLVFVPQSISKALLNRLLLSLCENSKTRADLLSLFLCILQDGSTDLAAVDRSFMDLSIHKGKLSKMEEEPVHAVVTPAENVPNLIAQRCLEILYYVVTLNDRSLSYFLTEHDSLSYLKHRRSIGNGRSKSKAKGLANSASVKYPILVLIGLLDRQVFLDNTALMEQLMNLLEVMCRPIPNLVSNYNKKKLDAAAHGHALQPPSIPNQYIQKVVDVLSLGDCSSHTFRSTINVLSRLSFLEGVMNTIINGLTSIANACGKQIIVDLEQLYLILTQLKAGAELEGSALAQFSAATSHQARLLRVLKVMDYLYTRNNKHSAPFDHAEQSEKALLKLYDKLDFLPLWRKLGACLSLIQEREDLLNVASVLLPLVESFMAVSKYVNNKGYTAKSSSEASNPAEEFFLSFTEDHKKILNIMVRNNPSLMSGSFSLLIHNPKILEFDNKRNYFVQQLHKRTNRREQYPSLRLSLDRANVFEDTYRKLQGLTGDEIKYGKLNVHFHGEEGVDAGGVAREWFSVLARQMFDPNYALFITSAADKLTYQPNRASGVNSEHLSYFKCVGRIIGKAIHDGRLLDAYFTRSFYKLMLGRSVDYRDVEAVDPAYYKSLVWMLENDITDIIDLTFSVETDDFGTNKIIDLKPNGRNIPVTEENKHEYVTLVTEQKLVLAIKDQVNAFLEGFHDVIPPSLIQIFNEQELELLISGLPDIDIDEWKANTVYEGYTLSSPQIQWFWRTVRSFDQEERAKLLQFATGTSKVPLEGFAKLQGSNGVQKFQIHKEFGDVNRLPSAHTCFNQIDLPQYQTYEDLRTNLFKAINECSTGFAFQ